MPVVPLHSHGIQPGQNRMLIRAKTKTGVVEFEARPDEAILYAALRSGAPMPYECATGTCGTCKARRSSGEVDVRWPDAPGCTYLKPERNEFLMCQAVARSACEIEVPAPIDMKRAPVHVPVHGHAKICGVERLTHDVVAVHLETDPVLLFQPGQFIVMRTPDVTGYRAYSMVNRPDGGKRLEFVLKRKPDGRFCDWIFDADRHGAALEWFGPLGKATFDPAEQRSILAIAGGSGIASIMSILAAGHEARHFDHFEGAVFFGVRSNQDIFYAERLNAHAATFPNLKITIALSHEAPSDDTRRRYPAINFDSGFVHEVAARDMAGRMAGRVAYLAGPPPMVDAAIRMLILQARLPASDVRYDKFG